MFQLMHKLTVQQLLARQCPALLVSVVVAELFYKFHSFTLECGAFLGTWFVLDGAAHVTLSLLGRPRLDPRAAAE